MKYLALDTNIYLDMVVSRNKSHKPEAYEQMKRLLDYGEVKLVVPSIIIREVNRHVNNEIEKIHSHLNLIKKNVESLYWINNVEEMKLFKEKIPNATSVIKEVETLFESNKERYITDAINLFRGLFSHENVVHLEETPEHLFRAQLRQLHKKRPFHYSKKDKDSLADAVIIESLIQYTKNKLAQNDCLYFITRNTVDFSSTIEKETLHPEIQESIEMLNLENQFYYRNHLNKTLIVDFKLETEHAGFLEDLKAEMYDEQLKELEEMELNHHRELGGLPSLSADWEEIISEHREIENFINKLLEFQEELTINFEGLSDRYFDLIDRMQQLNLINFQQAIRNFNSNDDEEINITNNLKDMQSEIIEIINERISIDIENIESSELWKCEDCFTLENTLLIFEDFNSRTLTVTVNGDLNPENKGNDLIEVSVNDTILNKNKKGNIEVSYGYMYFDEDNHPTDGMKDEVTFNLEEVIDSVQSVSEYLINQMRENLEIIRDINNKLGL